MTNDSSTDPTRPLAPHTTAEGLANARVAAGWDAGDVTTVYLPRPVVQRLLADRGWTRADPQRPWHAPTGEPFWDVAEALQMALSAEALDPTRGQDRPTTIDSGPRREFINNILAHDTLLDEVDALLYEHVVEGEHRPAAVAATLRRLTLAAVTGATPEDWQDVAEHLIADVRELEADARHNPKTDRPRSSER
ncbi:MAG: hypothetical protein JWQ18_2744 [Conexibacter sp.]|nr:hypothetical protein [Conexibacter sp.]